MKTNDILQNIYRDASGSVSAAINTTGQYLNAVYDSTKQAINVQISIGNKTLTQVLSEKEDVANKGLASGYCELDVNTQIPFNRLPFDINGAININGLFVKNGSETIDDDGMIVLPTGTSGWGSIQVGDNEEFAEFKFSANGTVVLVGNSTNIVNTDTDGKFCIMDNGDGIAIKNSLGSAKNIAFDIKYRVIS